MQQHGRVLVATLAAAALMQAPWTVAAEEQLEEVVVMGTHIPRRDYVSPSPVFTVQQESIALSGTSTMAEYLNRFPQFRPDFGATSNNPGNGTSKLNLRGLGAERTLILLNGRRMGAGGADSVIDVNTIPPSMIERVEVLTGGASATYGSDAMAGAVNFHLRRDIDGIELQAGYQRTEQSDGDIADLSLAGGTSFASGRGRISGFITYTDREVVYADERSFSSVPLENDFFTGELFPGGSNLVPEGRIPEPTEFEGNFYPEGLIFESNGDLRGFEDGDYFNYQPYNYLQTDLERTALGAFSEFDFSDDLIGRFDVLYSQRDSGSELAPSLWPNLPLNVNIDNPGFTPDSRAILEQRFPPDENNISEMVFAWRSLQLGPRKSDYDRESWRADIGLDGLWLSDWRWRASYIYSRMDETENPGGAINGAHFRQGMLVDPATGECFDPSGGCVAVNPFGFGNLSDEAADYISYPGVENEGYTEQQLVSVVTDGKLDITSSYSLDMAVGLEYRRDEADFDPDPRVFDEEYIGVGSSPAIAGSIEVWEVFVEAVVPLLEDLNGAKNLQLEMGYRYSDYSTAGGVDTWKVGLIWEPTDTLIFRTMQQRAVRAPTAGDLYSAQTEFYGNGFFLGDDLCSAEFDPVANGLSDVCIAQGLPAEELGQWQSDPFALYVAYSGGEQNLEPEESDTFTFGVTWRPEVLTGLSVALDYYEIDIAGAITELSDTEVVQLCFQENSTTSSFCRSVRRGNTNDIAEVDAKLFNVGEFTTEGIDLQLEYAVGLPSMWDYGSSLSLQLVYNYALDYSYQATPASDRYECAGFFAFPCETYPEHRANTRLAWLLGDFTTELNWRWLDGMENALPLFFEGTWDPKTVDSHSEFDLNFGWAVSEHVQLFAGVINLTDEDPPILGGFGADQSNTDPRQYDVLGRRYHAGLTWRF